MKLIKNISIIASFVLVLTGCEDFLEPNSKSEFVPKDATSLNELLLGEAYQRNDMGGFYEFLGLLEDDIEATEYQAPIVGFDENKYVAGFTWQPDMFKMIEEANAGRINMYKKHYELILGANAVLDYLPEVTDTEEMKNIVRAQAYALRGFYYFNLVNIFGQPYNYNKEALGVPLKLNSGIEESDDYLKRKTVAEVYAQVLSDLHAAEATYLELPEAKQMERKYKCNLPMVQLLLSRTYLYMENWEEAAKYAKKVMDNTEFELLDLTQIPVYDDDGNHMHKYINYSNAGASEAIFLYGYPDDMFKWVYEYTNKTNMYEQYMHAYFKPSEDLLNSFEPGDMRFWQYIVEAPVQLSKSADDVEYRQMAYGKILLGEEKLLPMNNATGYFGRSLRLSEAYLNYAEAILQCDNDGVNKATEVLNKLRAKRIDPNEGLPEVHDENYEPITDKDGLMKFIKEERRRELCFEGHRWFDLRRWGMPEIKHVWHISSTESYEYILKEKDLMYTVPIPDEALQENSQLVQNELPEKRTYTTSTANNK